EEPTGRKGTRYAPRALVSTSRFNPVCSFVTVMRACASMACEGSRTTPAMLPLVSCATTGVSAAPSNAMYREILIHPPVRNCLILTLTLITRISRRASKSVPALLKYSGLQRLNQQEQRLAGLHNRKLP